MLIIPMTNDASQRFTVLAGGQETVVTLSWNDAAGAWIADISLSDGTALVRGRRVCAGVPVLKQFGIRLVQEFDGDFVAFPRSQPVTEPGRLAWGATHDFLYIEKGEAVDAATFAGAGS
jgi:hypothetical protein